MLRPQSFQLDLRSANRLVLFVYFQYWQRACEAYSFIIGALKAWRIYLLHRSGRVCPRLYSRTSERGSLCKYTSAYLSACFCVRPSVFRCGCYGWVRMRVIDFVFSRIRRCSNELMDTFKTESGYAFISDCVFNSTQSLRMCVCFVISCTRGLPDF